MSLWAVVRAACPVGVGLSLGCGWLCFDGLERAVLPAFLWGTPLGGGGGVFTVSLAAGFALWAWKAESFSARCGARWIHATQGAALALALGAAAGCQGAMAGAPYLAPLCLALCGALQCALWCGILLSLPHGTAWAALVAAATASGLLACGCAAAPPDWLPWLFCYAVAQSWPLAAWCAARLAVPRRGRGRPPKPKRDRGFLPRLAPALAGLAYALVCLASPLAGKPLPPLASCMCFAAGAIVCRLADGVSRDAWLAPGCCLACCCGVLLPGLGGAVSLTAAEGCLAAAALRLAGMGGQGAAPAVGRTLCCAALAGNLVTQLGLLGARSGNAAPMLTAAGACAALGAAACAAASLLPLWRQWQRGGAQDRRGDPVLDVLTAQEKLVFGLLGEGCGNRVIAEKLNISEPTVRFHLRSIYKKTGQSGRPGLEDLARRHATASGGYARGVVSARFSDFRRSA